MFSNSLRKALFCIKCLTFVVIVGSSFCVNAQNNFCGTVVSSDYYQKQVAIASAKGKLSNDINQCLNKTLSIYVHLVLDSNKNANINIASLYTSVDSLNKAFSPICLQFKICKIDSVYNWNYDTFDQTKQEKDLFTLAYVPNVINWFFVQTITSLKDIDGYTFQAGAGQKDAVVLEKKTLLSKKPIIHQMGHFFGLLHTSQPTGNNTSSSELVDGSNCSTTGDLVCDTQADPYTTAGNPGSFNGSCQYSGSKDAKGQWYTPPAYDYMSLWPESCVCCFSPGQYNRLVAQFHSFRSYLW